MTTSTVVFTDSRLLIDGCDLSWQSNEIEFGAESDEKDITTFRSDGWKELRGSMPKASVKASGMTEFGATGTVDVDTWTGLGATAALTVGPEEIAAGGLAYLTKLLRTTYVWGGKVGEVCPWEAEGSSAWPVVRGAWLAGPGSAIIADGSSTAVELGAMSATQRLYAALHVISVAGTTPTIDVIIESDSVQAFTGSPETRLTFTQANAVGGQIIRTAAGANTDTWYRATYDISASGGESFLIAVSIGIL